jgi:hypothetical protein
MDIPEEKIPAGIQHPLVLAHCIGNVSDEHS